MREKLSYLSGGPDRSVFELTRSAPKQLNLRRRRVRLMLSEENSNVALRLGGSERKRGDKEEERGGVRSVSYDCRLARCIGWRHTRAKKRAAKENSSAREAQHFKEHKAAPL